MLLRNLWRVYCVRLSFQFVRRGSTVLFIEHCAKSDDCNPESKKQHSIPYSPYLLRELLFGLRMYTIVRFSSVLKIIP